MSKRIITFLCCFLCLAGYNSFAQLAGGTYTINSALPTAGTNYQTFGAAVTAMASGVSGPVVFNVVAGSGPYNEMVTIGNITGASATNTIKFNGNGATVQYTPTATYQAAFNLNGAKYVKIDSLTLKSTVATYGFGFNVYNGCTFDSITRCVIDLTNVTSTASANSQGIRVASTQTSTSSTTAGATSSFFGFNTIKGATGTGGPYYALYCYGSNGSGPNVFYKNKISNFYIYGLYDYYTCNEYRDNEIERATLTSVAYCYGIYSYYPKAGMKVIGNRVHSLGGSTPSTSYCYPVYINYGSGTATNPIIIANNAVYNMTSSATYGIYYWHSSSYTGYVYMVHNTVDMRVPVSYTGANYGMYIYGPQINNVFANNNISITAGGTGSKYGLYLSTFSGGITQRNNVYVNSTQTGTQYYAYHGANYTTQAAFQAAFPTYEVGSTIVDPQFVAPATGNFTPTNTAMFATGINLQSIVPTDIVGQSRLAAPAPGCYEFAPSGTNNGGMISITNPVGLNCPGSYPLKANIYNAGTNNITSMKVNWSVNGVTQPQYTYTGTLTTLSSTSGSPIAEVTLGNITLPPGGAPVAIKIWTSLPNNAADAVNANDTLVDTLESVVLDIVAQKDTICLNKGSVVYLTPATGLIPGGLQWQSSINSGTTWPGTVTTDNTTFVTPNLTGNTWFRARLITGTNTCYSDTVKVYTTDPVLYTHTPDTMRCGPGPMLLQGTASNNATVKWYDNATSMVPIATGNQFTTPYLAVNTSYWVSTGPSSSQPAPANVVVDGTQTTYTGVYNPFSNSYANTKTQYIVTAEEMLAQGFSAGNITSVGLVTTTVSGPLVQNAVIAMKHTNLTTSNTSFELTGLTEVYSGSINFTANATNTINFTTPFYWDGASNLIISFCGTNNTMAGSNTFVTRYNSASYKTYYNYSATVNQCTNATAYSYYYRPHLVFGMTSACETPKVKIDVTVNPLPVVDLGQDINQCIDSGYGVVLDAGLQPYNGQYMWDNGVTNQVRAVFQTGNYFAKVTNQFGCVGSDTISVTLREKPVVELGNDTTICIGTVLTLDAGNDGIDYFWNTGQTTNTINISSPNTYNVFVTNAAGCVTTDTIKVKTEGYLPTVDYVQITNNGVSTFHFTAVNPQNVIGYEWDFGDGTPLSYQATPNHTYAAAGSYIVTLNLSSTCGYSADTSSVHILGLGTNDLNKDLRVSLYPNPTQDLLTIKLESDAKMESIVVYNILGQMVKSEKVKNEKEHSISLSNLSNGLYQVKIVTNKGNVTQKVDLVK